MVAGGRREERLSEYSAQLLGFRGNTKAVAFLRQDGHVYEWDAATHNVALSELDALQSPPFQRITSARYAPHGQAVVVVFGKIGPVFYERDPRSGALRTGRPLEQTILWPQTTCAFAPDGQRFALARLDGVRVYSTNHGMEHMFSTETPPQHLSWVGSRTIAYETVGEFMQIPFPTGSPPERRHRLYMAELAAKFEAELGERKNLHVANVHDASGVFDGSYWRVRIACLKWSFYSAQESATAQLTTGRATQVDRPLVRAPNGAMEPDPSLPLEGTPGCGPSGEPLGAQVHELALSPNGRYIASLRGDHDARALSLQRAP